LNETAQQCAASSAVSDLAFWEKTKVEGECLVFTGYRDRQGYGSVFRKFVAPSPLLAHRYAFYLANGPIAEGVVIRHTCDNPPCVLPAHLLSGTQADNIADRQARGRHRPGHLHGEDHPGHKLTNEDVLEIRVARRNGYSNRELATFYGVSRRTIWMAATGQTWKHLKDAA